MNSFQLSWAMAHSWYISNHVISGSRRVVVWDLAGTGTTRTFEDFDKLQEWAGY